MRALRRIAGTLPSAIRRAIPSTMAVLPNAWLANQHGIILLAAAQHRQHAAYLTITPSGGVELAIARLGGQVATELVEGRRLAILVHLVLLALGLGGVTLRLEAEWRLAAVLLPIIRLKNDPKRSSCAPSPGVFGRLPLSISSAHCWQK